MRFFSFPLIATLLFLNACDRHEWESSEGTMGTKELYIHHGDDHGGYDKHDKSAHDDHVDSEKKKH